MSETMFTTQVDYWKDRAERAEAENAVARSALKVINKNSALTDDLLDLREDLARVRGFIEKIDARLMPDDLILINRAVTCVTALEALYEAVQHLPGDEYGEVLRQARDALWGLT